uniref:MARVEL domain-containing protein n=1 Tax=Panagrellus redivivus TaxID=6233 RepID=A0A7E4UVN0_PANRE
MDFDPDHAKWQCCCCHLASGLKILASIELSFSALILIFTGINLFTADASNQDITDTLFTLGMIFTLLVFGVTSALLIVGIAKKRDYWMYPSLCARVILIMFVTIFGVKQVVVDPDENAKEEAQSPKMINGKPVLQHDEPPMVLRLIFFMFLMIFVCIGVMYTIYLVVRCIRYVQAYARLEKRRASLIIAGQIDPEMMNGRRGSRASQI